MALVSASDLYPYLPGLDSGADSALGTLIAAVESQLAQWCGFYPESAGGSVSWDSATREIYIDGPSDIDARMLQLPILPVTAVASIYDDPTWAYSSSAYLVSSGDYNVISREGQVWLKPDASWSWSTGKRNIKVTCTVGYSSATRQISLATLHQCAHAYQMQKGGAGRTRSQGKEVSSDYNLPPILPSVRALLAEARCPNLWLS